MNHLCEKCQHSKVLHSADDRKICTWCNKSDGPCRDQQIALDSTLDLKYSPSTNL